jgi:site-specific DNA-methyltransferase (adenine-specific)
MASTKSAADEAAASAIPTPLRSLAFPLNELVADPRNARTHDERNLRAIEHSLRAFGWRSVIVAHKATRQILAGNARAVAATRLGWTHAPVVFVDGDRASSISFAIADNRTAELAEWDETVLRELLAELDGDAHELLELDLRDVEAELGASTRRVREDDAAATATSSAPARVKCGELWRLGDHRLLCGDSTIEADVDRVLGEERPELVLADPPYFAKVVADWDNDFADYAAFLDFVERFLGLWTARWSARATLGVWCAPDFAWDVEARLRKFARPFNHLCWKKGSSLETTASVEDMRRWRPRSERLLLAEIDHSPGAMMPTYVAAASHKAAREAYAPLRERLAELKKRAKLTAKDVDAALGTSGMSNHYFGASQWTLPTREAWEKLAPLFAGRGVELGDYAAFVRELDGLRRRFDRSLREFNATTAEDDLTDVWDMQPPRHDERHGHPTPKPVALIAKLVVAHSRPGDLVADPFLGSGTTLVACEQTGRRCAGVEISPSFCDAILARWEAISGKSAKLEASASPKKSRKKKAEGL